MTKAEIIDNFDQIVMIINSAEHSVDRSTLTNKSDTI